MIKATGHIYKRNGILYISYTDPSKKGGHKRESTGGNCKRDAKKLLEQKLGPLHNRAVGWAETNAFYKQHFIDFLKLYKEGTETHKSYKGILKLFIQFINERYPNIQYLHEFKTKVFDDYRVWLKETRHKDWTAKNHLKVLKTVFRKAEEWEMINKVPKINTAIAITDYKPIRTLSDAADFQRFFSVCKEMKPEYYLHYFILARTGLRFGEMKSLLWQNVDLENATITVAKTEDFTPKGRWRKSGLPKTRTVPLTRDTVEALRSLPKSPTYNYVFLRDGKPLDKGAEKNLRYWLHKIAKTAGINGMTRIHELRHTYGQKLYEISGDLYVVKEALGHTDLRTTMRYAGKPTKRVKDAVKKMEGFGMR